MQRHGSPEVTLRTPPGNILQRSDGYLEKRVDGTRKLHHVLIVENLLGRKLPKGVEVHHVNEIRSDNRNENLVVCQDRHYHQLIHARQRAYDACGNANWKKCAYCKTYDDPKNMTGRSSRGDVVNTFYHKSCAAKYARDRKLKNISND